MELRKITEGNFAGTAVMVRVDFNVELDVAGNVLEHYKLDVAKKTIDYLCSQPGARVALVTHFGRPEGKVDARYSVKQIVDDAERALGRPVYFASDCVGAPVDEGLKNLKEGEVLLLENVRFHSEEEAGNDVFASELARPFGAFVNEAFSASHRDHSSVTGVAKILPSYAGFQLLQEVEQLEKVLRHPEHPAVAVVGGAKSETKVPLIRELEKTYDAILVGGKVANEILDQKMEFSDKVVLPIDFDSPDRLDIGRQTTTHFTEIIAHAKTIVWNGPMGKFEEGVHSFGTYAILKSMLESDAFVVVGGGESLIVLEKMGVSVKNGFVSSGGGAMLDFLSGADLPGVSVLIKREG